MELFPKVSLSMMKFTGENLQWKNVKIIRNNSGMQKDTWELAVFSPFLVTAKINWPIKNNKENDCD